jgi:hypothetical protein
MATPRQARIERRLSPILADRMGRWVFVCLVVGAVISWPLEVSAQRPVRSVSATACGLASRPAFLLRAPLAQAGDDRRAARLHHSRACLRYWR